MGQPIKDRGIKWVENYGDKSAHLKEEFEAQVGPGSYFRWEGHDFTTSTDYYVVVTPGFSKKHGYHFFAGLRKEPAENGASGKHFHTQGEAMSYAIDKWNVPRPQAAPHKPYVAKDLEGKPIVTENVHANTDAEIIKISGRGQSMTIIDATQDDELIEASSDEPMEKTAMALHSMRAPRFIPQFGSNTLPAVYQNAARMSSIMGTRAALRTKLEFITVDGQNWDKDAKGHNDVHGTQNTSLPDSPLMATCQPVDANEFDEVVNREGISVTHKLFDFARNGELTLTQPSGTVSPGYKVVKFSHVQAIEPKIKVPFAKKAEFDAAIAQFQSQSGVVISEIPKGPRAKKSNDYTYSGRIPIDHFGAFEKLTENLASVSPPGDHDTRNALKLYKYYEDRGETATPEGKQRVMNTPVFEEYHGIKGAHALTFDKRGKPLGIDVARSRRIGMEGENPKAKIYVLKSDVLNGWNQQFDGDWNQVRDALYSGQIPIDASMFVDSRTCAPKIMPVLSVMPKVDLELMPETENGKVVNEVRPVAPECSISATEGVRVFNPQTGRLHYQRIPSGVQAQQTYNGHAVVMESSKSYVPVDTGNGTTELREVPLGEWDVFDPDSNGKFIPGESYRFSISPENASPKKTDVAKMHKLGLKRGGWGIYTAKVAAKMEWHDGPPSNLEERAAAQEIVTGADGQVIGYYGCVQRQYPNKAWSTSAPTEEEPIEIPIHEQNATGELMSTDRTFRLTADDAYKVGNDLMITSLPTAIKYLQYKYRLPDATFGPVPDVDNRDLWAVDEKVKALMSKIDAGVDVSTLEPWEQTLATFPKKGNRTPVQFLNTLVEAIDDPAAWEPKTGPIYGIFDHSTSAFVDNEQFVTPERAAEFKTFLERHPEYAGKQLEVRVAQDNVPLTASFRDRLAADPHAQFVENKDAYAGLEELADDEEIPVDDAAGEVSPEETVSDEGAGVPVETPGENPLQTSDTPYDDAANGTDPVMDDLEVFEGYPQQPQEAIPTPQPAQQNIQRAPDVEANNTLNKLVRLANRLDEEGKIEESQAVDKLIATISKKLGI